MVACSKYKYLDLVKSDELTSGLQGHSLLHSSGGTLCRVDWWQGSRSDTDSGDWSDVTLVSEDCVTQHSEDYSDVTLVCEEYLQIPG